MRSVAYKLEKQIGLYRQGDLSEREIVDSILFALTDSEEPDQLLQIFRQLPDDLQVAVLQQFSKLEETDYAWRPFLIGPGLDEEGRERLSRQLRWAHDAIRMAD